MNSTAVLNCAHQYASSPWSETSAKFRIYWQVDRTAGGLARIRTYTSTGKRSSAPGGSPHRAYCSRLIRIRRLCTMQWSFPCGDCRSGRRREGGEKERRKREKREREKGEVNMWERHECLQVVSIFIESREV